VIVSGDCINGALQAFGPDFSLPGVHTENLVLGATVVLGDIPEEEPAPACDTYEESEAARRLRPFVRFVLADTDEVFAFELRNLKSHD
jgi:hypothetical protein